MGHERARFNLGVRRMKISNPSPPGLPLPFDDTITSMQDYKHPLSPVRLQEASTRDPFKGWGRQRAYFPLAPEINGGFLVLRIVPSAPSTCSLVYYLLGRLLPESFDLLIARRGRYGVGKKEKEKEKEGIRKMASILLLIT